MASYREEEDPFEEDIVFDQAGLLTNSTKMNTAIRRVSSGKCALFAKTLGLCGAFFGLGLCIAIPGPTFLSPVTDLQADVSPISSIYAARTSGYLIGSIIGGFLFDYFNRLFLLFISLLLTAVFITVTPWCQVLWLLQACMVFLGMTMGFLDTGGNVLCLDLWGRNSGPFMQALHFSFGLGAFVAPLLAAPFLEPVGVLPTTMTSTVLPLQSDMRGKRELQLDNVTGILLDHTQLWSEDFISSELSSTTTSMIDFNVTNGLEVNESTVKPTSTTKRLPRPKPSKIKAGDVFGSKNFEDVHVKTPSKEDLMPVPTTSTFVETTSIAGNFTTKPDLKILTTPVFIKENNLVTTQMPSTTSNSGTTSPTLSDPIAVTPTTQFFSSSGNLKMLRANESNPIQNTNDSIKYNSFMNSSNISIQNEKKNIEGEKKTTVDAGESLHSYGALLESPQAPLESSTGSSAEDPRTLTVVETEQSTTGSMVFKPIRHKPVTYNNESDPSMYPLLDVIAKNIEKYGFSKIQFTYLMVGLFVFAISLVFLGFLCHNPRDPKSKQEEGQNTKKISNKALHGLLISLMALFFFLYVGLEVTYGQLVLAFAVHGDLQLARSTGLVIAFVFWGSFAAMRFASIFFSSCFGPITMLLLNFVFCTLGSVLLSSMASQTETALWVGTVLLGIGLASVFPTGILWIERYIHVSNKVAAAFVMGASLGEMVCPVAVYHLMVNNLSMLMHSAVVINILCILTFIALRWLALRHGEKYCVSNNNGYQLANQDEEEDMIDMSPSGSVIALRRHSFSSEHRALLNGNPHRGP